VSNYREMDWEDRQPLLAEAAELGVTLEPSAPLYELADAIRETRDYRQPCRECGVAGPRRHRFDCDLCVEIREAAAAAEREARERQWEARIARQEAAAEFIALLPAGRRRLVDMSGMDHSAESAFAEAYGEW